MSGSRPTQGRSLLRSLATTYVLLVGLVLGTGITGLVAQNISVSASDRVFRSVQPAREANSRVLHDLSEVQSGIRGFVLTGDRMFLDSARHGIRAYRRDAAALRALGRPAGKPRLVRRELAAADAWMSRYEGLVSGFRGAEGQVAGLRRLRDDPAAAAELERFSHLSASVDEALAALAVDLRADSAESRRLALAVLVAVLAVSVLLGSASAWRTSRRVVGPLSSLRSQVDRITAGQHGVHLDESDGPQEVRAVAAAINAMATESQRLRDAETDQLRARRLAHDVGLRIRESIDVHEVLALAVEEIGSSFGADRVFVRCLGDEGLGRVAAEWNELDVDPMDARTLDALSATGTSEQAVGLWSDVTVDSWTMGRDPAPLTDGGPGALAVARVLGAMSVAVAGFGAGSEALGTVTLVQLRQPRVWSEAETAALEAVAADLGRAMRHAGLYDRERSLVEQLRALDRTKTDFLSTVSHELRSPLTSITGYLELLRDESASMAPSQVRMLDVIERNSYRLSALIEDLLTLARIESGAAQTQRVPVDVPSLVRNAVADVEPAARDAGLDLVVLPGPDGVRVLGDPGLLDRVLLNLLSNAVKFTPRGGRVRASWEADGDDVMLWVEDNGIGIPEGDREALSSRFFRASNAMSAAIPGTGLGLSIVRGVLDNHAGRLEVDHLAPGTRMTVRIPRLGAAGAPQTGTPAAVARL